MRMRGLEPPRTYIHTDLNRARLPIPPHPRALVERPYRTCLASSSALRRGVLRARTYARAMLAGRLFIEEWPRAPAHARAALGIPRPDARRLFVSRGAARALARGVPHHRSAEPF